MKPNVFVILQFFIVIAVSKKKNDTNKYIQHTPAPKYDNPNFIRDRFLEELKKPEMPETWKHRHKQPYSPNWMDYCDPYHCNDYHKQACGLNRHHLTFKWFQSTCHMILNNMCAKYRGHLQYDLVASKFCAIYVRNLRMGCPQYCEDEINPVCAVDHKNRAAIFINQCALEMENCQRDYGYEEVEMSICNYYLKRGAELTLTYIS